MADDTLSSQTEASASKSRKARCPNFTKSEDSCLGDAVIKNYDQLFGRLSPTLTAKQKDVIWRDIAEEVSA